MTGACGREFGDRFPIPTLQAPEVLVFLRVKGTGGRVVGLLMWFVLVDLCCTRGGTGR